MSLSQDLGSSGYGVKAVEPAKVEKALKWLGGHLQRQSKGHPYHLIKMPTGSTVGVIASGGGAGEIGRGHLADLLRQCVEARLDPILFLAVLERLSGVTWHRRPAEVSKLSKWLRAQQPSLRTEALWQAALRDFRRAVRPPEAVHATPRSAATSAGAGQEAASPEPAGPEPTPTAEAATAPTERHTWTSRGVLDLADVPDDARSKAAQWLAKSAKAKRELPGELVDAGEIIRAQRGSGKRVTLLYTPKAAERLAQEIVDRWGTPEQKPIRGSGQIELPAPTVAGTGAAGAPRVEAPIAKPFTVEAVDVKPRDAGVDIDKHYAAEREHRTLPMGGGAVLAIARHYGVPILWQDGDSYRLDVESMLDLVVERMAAKGEL